MASSYRSRIARAVLTGAAVVLTGAAAPAPVSLSVTPSKNVPEVITKVYGDFIAQHSKEGHIESGITDLDHDGNAEIVVRFLYPFSCNGPSTAQSCYTTVLKLDPNPKVSWHEVFGFHTTSLAVMPGPKGEMADLVVDGRQRWQPIPTGGYAPDLASYAQDGKVLSVSTPVVGTPDMSAEVSSRLMASTVLPDAATLKAASFGGQFMSAKVDVGGSLGTLSVLSPPAITCGNDVGCPAVFYDAKGSVVLGGLLPGAFVVSAAAGPEGVHDVILYSSEGGAQFFRWDPPSHVFKLVATSYRSDVSPIP